MADKIIKVSAIQQRHDTVENWEAKNPILLDGEMITVVFSNGVVKHKTGYGGKRYNELPFDKIGDHVSSILFETVLSKDLWVNNKQSIAIDDLEKNQDGIIGISQNASKEQFKSAYDANLRVENQADGFLTITVEDTVPVYDIPISIILLPPRDGSIAVDSVLFADSWNEKQQAIVVNGLDLDKNGLIDISKNATDEQLRAAFNANLRLISQSNNTLIVIADGDIPTCDIPVSIILLP